MGCLGVALAALGGGLGVSWAAWGAWDGVGCIEVRRLGWSGHTKIIFIFEKIKQIKINYIISNQDIISNQRTPLDENFFRLVITIKDTSQLQLCLGSCYNFIHPRPKYPFLPLILVVL